MSSAGSQPVLPGELDLENLHETTDIYSTIANADDGVFRGSVMVLNPMDGVLDWGIPNA